MDPRSRPLPGRRAHGGANSGSWASVPATRFEAPTPSSRTGRRAASVLPSSSRAQTAIVPPSATGSGRVRERVTVSKS